MADKESEQNTDSEHESPSNSRVRIENVTLDQDGIRSEKLLQKEIKGLMLNSNYDLVKDRIEEFKQLLQEFKEAHIAYHSQLRDENEIIESNDYYDAAVHVATDLARDVGNWISSTVIETRLLQSQEELHPEDSISNADSRACSKSSRRSRKGLSIGSRASSHTSSISAARTQAAAKRAVLQAEAASLERFHALQEEELRIQQRRKALELQMEIGKVQAGELIYAEAGADHMATSRSFDPATNRPTYFQSAANSCPSESQPPKNELTLDKTDNRPQNFTEVPKVSKTLNPNADSWPCDDLKPEVEPSSLTVKEEPVNGDPPDTFLERLLATQSQQNSVMQQLLQRQQESTLALTLPQPEVPTFSRDPIEYWGFIRAFQNVIERKKGCNVCTKHSSFLHPNNNAPAANITSRANGASGAQQVDNQNVHNGFVNGRNEALGLQKEQVQASATGLAILPVKVKAKGSDRVIQTYAFLDNGSNASFCSEPLAKELKLSGKETMLSLTTMEKENSKTDCRVVSLEVLDLDEENLFELPIVFTRPSLPVTMESIANQQDVEKWQYLSEVKIPNIDADVGLLIGSDAPEILEPKQVIPSQNGGPYATRTTLGWVVNGPLGKVTNTNTCTANLIKADLRLNEQFQTYCDMEFNDLAYSEARSMSANDKRAMELMKNSINLENGHYQLALPWKNDPPCLENNRPVVDHHLKLLKQRLSRDPELRSKYKVQV